MVGSNSLGSSVGVRIFNCIRTRGDIHSFISSSISASVRTLALEFWTDFLCIAFRWEVGIWCKHLHFSLVASGRTWPPQVANLWTGRSSRSGWIRKTLCLLNNSVCELVMEIRFYGKQRFSILKSLNEAIIKLVMPSKFLLTGDTFHHLMIRYPKVILLELGHTVQKADRTHGGRYTSGP